MSLPITIRAGLVVAVALAQSVIIPAQKTANLVGMVSGQINARFPTEAIGSKILSCPLFDYIL